MKEQRRVMSVVMFFFNDTATTEIYTLSLHDALPILGARLQRGALPVGARARGLHPGPDVEALRGRRPLHRDRKSTRLNSSHANISYAVFCLKKKNPVRALLQDHHARDIWIYHELYSR